MMRHASRGPASLRAMTLRTQSATTGLLLVVRSQRFPADGIRARPVATRVIALTRLQRDRQHFSGRSM